MVIADAIKATAGGATLAVRAKPRASRSAVLGLVEDGRGVALGVALAAPPVEGAANAALIALLADLLGLPRRAVRVVRGEGSRHKLVEIDTTPEAILARLADLV